jgi:hypothetical protein
MEQLGCNAAPNDSSVYSCSNSHCDRGKVHKRVSRIRGMEGSVLKSHAVRSGFILAPDVAIPIANWLTQAKAVG